MPRLVFALLAAFAAPVHAQHVNWYVPFGTAGFGAGAAVSVARDFDMRVEYAGGGMNRNVRSGDLDFEAKLRVSNFSLLADWYAPSSNVRLSFGAVVARNTLKGTGRPSVAGTVEINDTVYAVPAGASVDANIDIAKGLRPYLGIGWSTRAKEARGFGFRADAGVIYGNPKVSLTTTGISGATLATDIANEQKKLEDKIDRYRFYPVVSMSLSYAF